MSETRSNGSGRRRARRIYRTLPAGSLPRASFRELVESAAGAGFDAVSVWARTHRRATTREGLSEADMRSLVDDHGLAVSEIEAVDTWLPVEVEPVAGNPPLPVDEFLGVAEALRARTVVAIQSAGAELPFEVVVEHFAALCGRARECGLDVALEAPPFTVIDDIAKAWAVVEAAGCANGGVLLDTWHHRRSGATDAALARISGDRVLCVQLADGPAVAEADLLEETIWRRMPLGSGDFGLGELLRRLDAMGVACPVGPEIYDEGGDHSDPAQTARRLAEQMDRLASAAGSDLGRAAPRTSTRRIHPPAPTPR